MSVMKVFFTGATGVIGREVVPRLVEAGHQVTAAVRSPEGKDWANGVGAMAVEVDLFDPEAVARAVSGHDAVFHFATSIPSLSKMSKVAEWEMNDRLRTEATKNLVEAALRRGVERFVQESITFTYADGGSEWIDEDAPLDTASPILHSALTSEEEVARFAASGGVAVVLRLSSLYGPRASTEYVRAIGDGRLPSLGRGENYVSQLHTEDAGGAVGLCVRIPGGTYNVSEDEPLIARDNLETLVVALGVKRPRRVPTLLAKAVAGSTVNLLTVSQRISNRRFKSVSGWAPKYPSVATGWPAVVAEANQPKHEN